MRNFGDAKAMAQTLRAVLAKRGVKLSHSESLELVAAMLGVSDWNTMSAALKASTAGPAASAAPRKMPAFPLRNLVAFPAAVIPLFVGRPYTVKALETAHQHRRELVLVAQKAETVDQPQRSDVYDVGVTAVVLDIGPAAETSSVGRGTRVLVQTVRRVAIRSFASGEAGYEAEVDEIDEGPLLETPDVVAEAAESVEQYAAKRGAPVPNNIETIRKLHDPGLAADMIAAIGSLAIAMDDRQTLLATFNPLDRLRSLVGHLRAA
jgi:ATP-dependent Lon protease